MSVTILATAALIAAAPVDAVVTESLANAGPPTASAEAADAPPPDTTIVVTATPEAKADPLAQVNVQSYKAVQAVDTAAVRPVAMAYKHALPRTVRTGLRNLLLNLTEPVVFVNYVLQLQPKRAAQVAGRFAINSTVGVAGVLDVAKNKPFHLKHHTNGFAYTLGYYGVPTGPYLFLPLIGPTTLRDVIGRLIDQTFLPATVGAPFKALTYSLPSGAVTALDFRVEADSALEKLHKADNPYAATRADYLARRKRDIAALRGPKHEIPLKDDTVPGVTIDVPEPGGAAPKPASPAVAPATPAPPVAAPMAMASPMPTTGLGIVPQPIKPVPGAQVLTPAAPPSTRPRP